MPRFNPLNDLRYRKKGWLFEQYVTNKIHIRKIARMCNADMKTIIYWIDKLNFPRQPFEQPKKTGKENPRWKGGVSATKDGYLKVTVRGNPMANSSHQITIHRLVASKALGRPLKRHEVVHHINGNKKDNRNINLLISTGNYHRWLEGKMAQLYKEEHFGHI
jgi:hypothetical protein